MKLLFLIILIFFSIECNSQSKKELEQRITTIEMKIDSLFIQIKSYKEKIGTLENLYNSKFNKIYQEIDSLKLRNIELSKSMSIAQPIKDNISETPKIINIKKLIIDYYKCPNWNERVNYICDTESISIMEQYYKSDYRAYLLSNEDIILTIDSNNLSDKQILNTSINFKTGFNPIKNIKFYIQLIGGEYKINWASTIGANQQTLQEIKTNFDIYNKSLKDNVKLKVTIQISDYCDNKPENPENYFFVRLSDFADGRILANVDKNSSEGIKLFSLLKKGDSHNVSIELSQKQYKFFNEYTKEYIQRNFYEVSKLIEENWW